MGAMTERCAMRCRRILEGIAWLLRQPVSYTGHRESMRHLARREGVMPSAAARTDPLPPTSF